MNYPFRCSIVSLLAAAALCGGGCASPENENILLKAGFDALKANTTTQLDIVNKMNPYQILALHKNGRTFYAVPDPVHSQIYIGTEQDFARYRKLRAGERASVREEELPVVENQGAAVLNAWSDWPGWSV